jgi:hypothetical protein
MKKTIKLIPELIPRTSFFKNLRSMLTSEQWDIIRKATYQKASHRCEICDADGRIECHEIWEYNDNEKNSIQKLVGLIALCPKCHEVKHLGFAQLNGRLKEAMRHMSKINGMTNKETERIVIKAFGLWEKRSEKKWELDISELDKLMQNKA